MIIQSGELQQRERKYEGELPASILELEGDPFLRAAGAIHYELQAQRLAQELLVRGALDVELECRCARCAEWFRCAVRVPAFLRSYELVTENESIDLTAYLREDILLALPMNQLCSEGCRGRCVVCGINLNKQTCVACHARQKTAAWDALDQLNLTE